MRLRFEHASWACSSRPRSNNHGKQHRDLLYPPHGHVCFGHCYAALQVDAVTCDLP